MKSGPTYKKYSQKSTKQWKGNPSFYEQLQKNPETKIGLSDLDTAHLEPVKETIAALLV
jgi:hypothetical protein